MNINLDIGDTILTGRFKNKAVVAKQFGKDAKGQPTVNGRPMLKFRIKKLMQNIFPTEQNIKEQTTDISFSKEEMSKLHNDGSIEKDGKTYTFASEGKLKEQKIRKIIRQQINETLDSAIKEAVIWKDFKKYPIQKPPRGFAKKAKMGAMIHFTGPKSGAKGETWSKVYQDEWMAIWGAGVKGDTLSSKDLDKKLESHGRVQIKETVSEKKKLLTDKLSEVDSFVPSKYHSYEKGG